MHEVEPRRKLINSKPRQKEVQIEQNQVGKPVTENNFLPILIESFRASRGSYTKQVVFFEWIKAVSGGWQWEKYIEYLCKNGGLEAFSQTEQEVFQQAFLAVTNHSDMVHEGGKDLDSLQLSTRVQLKRLLPEWNWYSKGIELAALIQKKYEESLSEMSRKNIYRILKEINPNEVIQKT